MISLIFIVILVLGLFEVAIDFMTFLFGQKNVQCIIIFLLVGLLLLAI